MDFYCKIYWIGYWNPGRNPMDWKFNGIPMEYLWIFFENIPKFHKLGSKIHGILMELNGI